jgi:hypothetical protein
VTLLSKKDLADIRYIAERAGGLGLNPHSTLKLLDAYEHAAEATALLERIARVLYDGRRLPTALIEETIAFSGDFPGFSKKARAPAQPAAPTLLEQVRAHGERAVVEDQIAQFLDEQPAAPVPEPSAEPVAKERYLLQCEVAESLRVKLERAESKLGAVREVVREREIQGLIPTITARDIRWVLDANAGPGQP